MNTVAESPRNQRTTAQKTTTSAAETKQQAQSVGPSKKKSAKGGVQSEEKVLETTRRQLTTKLATQIQPMKNLISRMNLTISVRLLLRLQHQHILRSMMII